MGLLCTPRVARRHAQLLQSMSRRPRVLGRPTRPNDRTQRAKLEIPFGHAFDRREISSSKSAVRTAARRHFKPAHLPDRPGYGGGNRRRAVCLDERRRIVDSRRDPRTYFSAAAACGPRHSRLDHPRKHTSMQQSRRAPEVHSALGPAVDARRHANQPPSMARRRVEWKR
jgi:hypothetical protein